MKSVDGDTRHNDGTFSLDLFGSSGSAVIDPTVVCEEFGIDGSWDVFFVEINKYVGKVFDQWEKLEDEYFWTKARNHKKDKVYTYGLYQDNNWACVTEYAVFTHKKFFTQKEFQAMYDRCVILCKRDWDEDNPSIANLWLKMNEEYGFEIYTPNITYEIIDMEVKDMFIPNPKITNGERNVKDIFDNLSLEEKKELKEMIESQDEVDIRNERIDRLGDIIEKKCESTSPNNADFEEAIMIVEKYLKELILSLEYYIPTTLIIGDVKLTKPVDCVKLEAEEHSEIMDIVYFFKGSYGIRSFLADLSPNVFDDMLDELERLLIKEDE